MLIIGANLLVLAREMDVLIKKIATYKIDNRSAATLYETDAINWLLNINVEVYKRYNAWMTIPGEYGGFSKDTMFIYVNKVLLKVLRFSDTNMKEEVFDLFEYINSLKLKKPRIFDIAWTVARINDLTFEELLKRHAVEW